MNADHGRSLAAGSGRFREDAASFRASLSMRLGERDLAFANPWAERAERRDWRVILLANPPVQMLLLAVAGFLATAAVVTLLGVIGPGIAMALLASPPAP
ncbi:MAG: hypothetical protein F4103_16645 [Boseongicola sp. SB0673_bin_14]|nr:hypothetical protein [Boseongicola sp. SB0667_bin_21]MYI70290.1 hypothetical protein [Boseongicola sp. SB0673_bin_14]